MTCEQAEMLLAQYLLDQLEPQERAAVQAHLAQCPACSEKLGDLRVVTGLLGDALTAGAVPTLSPDRRAQLLAAARASDSAPSEAPQPLAGVAASRNPTTSPIPHTPASRPRLPRAARRFRGRLRFEPIPLGPYLRGLGPLMTRPLGSYGRTAVALAASLALAAAGAGILLPSLGTARRTARSMNYITSLHGESGEGLILPQAREVQTGMSLDQLAGGETSRDHFIGGITGTGVAGIGGGGGGGGRGGAADEWKRQAEDRQLSSAADRQQALADTNSEDSARGADQSGVKLAMKENARILDRTVSEVNKALETVTKTESINVQTELGHLGETATNARTSGDAYGQQPGGAGEVTRSYEASADNGRKEGRDQNGNRYNGISGGFLTLEESAETFRRGAGGKSLGEAVDAPANAAPMEPGKYEGVSLPAGPEPSASASASAPAMPAPIPPPTVTFSQQWYGADLTPVDATPTQMKDIARDAIVVDGRVGELPQLASRVDGTDAGPANVGGQSAGHGLALGTGLRAPSSGPTPLGEVAGSESDRKHADAEWRGGVGWNDNHAEFETSARMPNTKYGTSAPELELDQIKTEVSVADSGTLMLGGQRQVTDGQVETGLPVLSKIPPITRFFTSTSNVKDERTQLEVSKPTIIVESDTETPNARRISLNAGVDVVTEYTFRGLVQENADLSGQSLVQTQREGLANQEKRVEELLKGAAQLRREGDYEAATRTLDDALAIAPDNTASLAMKEMTEDSQMYLDNGRIERQRALEISKGSVDKKAQQAEAKKRREAVAQAKAVEPKEPSAQAQSTPQPAPQPQALPPASNFKAGPVNPWAMTQADRFSTFGLDVDTASYRIAANYIGQGYRPPPASVRMEEYINAFDYNLRKSDPAVAARVFTVDAQAAPSPFAQSNENLTLVKVSVQGKVIGREGRKPANLTFVIDASGSMAAADRLPLVQAGIAAMLDELSPQDRVSVVAFSSGPSLVVEAQPAANKAAIMAQVNAIRCQGSTNLAQGLATGYQVAQQHFMAGGINRVMLCSDGVATIGPSETQDLLANAANQQRQGITMTAVGVGLGAYNDDVLVNLANKGDGNYVFADSLAGARTTFRQQMAALQTIAKDAKIQVEWNSDRVRRYRLIGYEKREIADQDFRNDAIDAGEVGSGQSSTALYEVELLPVPAGTRPEAVSNDLGKVFVRYRDLDSGQVEEIEQRLHSEIVQQRTASNDPRFHLAASAAQFGELLRRSPHAQNRNLADVQRVLQDVANQLPLDIQARELLELVKRAQGLPEAP
ncbi:MAG: von Willebrand factor type A domain-containing protein [Phycisphaeraceae bacterium]